MSLNENYWAKNLPIKKGTENFGIIRYEYYKDRSIESEKLLKQVI